MAGATLVEDAVQNGSGSASVASQFSGFASSFSSGSRTSQKSKMATGRLESVWLTNLTKKGWSAEAAKTFVTQWVPSTQRTYDHLIEQFIEFISTKGLCLLTVKEPVVIEFLQLLLSSLSQPRSTLSAALAALSHFYQGLGVRAPMTQDVHRFVGALVKVETTLPLCHSSVFDISALRNMFIDWDRTHMDVAWLRMKAIVLMAVSLMLRPSDIAPKSLERHKNGLVPRLFRKSQIVQEQGALRITLFGNKNDYSRDGQQVLLQPSSEA